MGVSSPLTGRLIDRYGGRPVMIAGAGLTALGCIGLALAHAIGTYYAAWLCLGLAMRASLYDAVFAALARIGGHLARRPMSQITLLGGIASTVFWPIGHGLAELLGWRGAVLAYAAFALLTVPLHLMIPRGRYVDAHTKVTGDRPEQITGGREQLVAAGLYALIAALVNFLNSAMSAHMIGLLAGLGLVASVSVWVAALRGIGQSSARLCEVLFGARLQPLDLNLAAMAILPLGFAAGLFGGQMLAEAIAFAFLYGAGNGIAIITRGTLPLVLFEQRSYGAFVGRLLVPSFILSAIAPVTYAFIIDRFGDAAALYLSIAIAGVALSASIWLRVGFGRPRRLA